MTKKIYLIKEKYYFNYRKISDNIKINNIIHNPINNPILNNRINIINEENNTNIFLLKNYNIALVTY